MTACSQDLAAYKEDAKQEIESYVSAEDYSTENWLAVLEIIEDGKAVINNAKNNSAVETAVTNAKTSINEIAKEEVTVDGISNQFDLTELKEYWTGSINDDFEDDRIVVIMKKTTIYPELELETFGLDNAESLHYSFLAPKNENPNFHQILVIFLKTKGKDQVILAINELNKLDFIKTASPEYIYGTQDD